MTRTNCIAITIVWHLVCVCAFAADSGNAGTTPEANKETGGKQRVLVTPTSVAGNVADPRWREQPFAF